MSMWPYVTAAVLCGPYDQNYMAHCVPVEGVVSKRLTVPGAQNW